MMDITINNSFPKEHMIRLLLALFILIFGFIIFSNYEISWQVRPDTYGYIEQEVTDPWRGQRSPGLPLFWEVLGVRNDLRNTEVPMASNKSEVEKASKDFPVLNKALTRIADAQSFILAFSFALLFLSLNNFVPKTTSLLICLFCICFSPLSPANAILTDSLANSLCIIFVALTLFWFVKKGLILLFLLCLVAIYAVLVRPDFGFLSLAALIMCLTRFMHYLLQKQIKKAVCAFFIMIFLCAGTLLWPVCLSITGHVLVSGQVEYLAKRAFAIHLLEKGDENLYSDPVSRAFVSELIKNKSEYNKSLNEKYFSKKGRENYSPSYIFHYLLHPYSSFYEKHALKYFKWKSLPEMLEQTNNICNPIIRHHFSNYLSLVTSNFLASIDFYPDMVHHFFANNLRQTIPLIWLDNLLSRVNRLLIYGYNINFYFFILSYLIVILAFIVCPGSRLRFPIIFIAFLYIVHMLLISLNHAIYFRYCQMSQITLLLATLLSIYILSKKLASLQRKRLMD